MRKNLLLIFALFLSVVLCAQEVLYPFQKRGKTGWINNKGEVIIPPSYTLSTHSDSFFHNGIACVLCPDGNYNYINQKGEYISDSKYVDCKDFSEGLALVRESGKDYGFINVLGEYEIPPQYGYAESFREGLAVIRIDGLYGYINHNGDIVIQPSFTRADSFCDGLAYVSDSEGSGWIDAQGNFVIRYDDVFSNIKEVETINPTFSCGVTAFKCLVKQFLWSEWKLYLWMLLKPNGDIINPQVEVFNIHYDYDSRENGFFSEGLACVGVVTDPTYSNVGTVGYYIDTDGFVAINNQIEKNYSIVSGENFSEGYAAVLLYDNNKKKRSGYGYINKLGHIVIAPCYEYAGKFNNGIALVEKGKKAHYINKKGEIIFTFKY